MPSPHQSTASMYDVSVSTFGGQELQGSAECAGLVPAHLSVEMKLVYTLLLIFAFLPTHHDWDLHIIDK